MRSNLKILLVEIYFFINAFEGIIRYILYLIGLELIIYVKDLIILLIVAIYMYEGKYSKKVVWAISIVTIFFAYGIINIGNIAQASFAILKNILPFFAGISVAQSFRDENNIEHFIKFSRKVFILSVIGVLLNIFIQYPWSGIEYNLGSMEIEVARQWLTNGRYRLGGFTRQSSSAAVIICIYGLMSMYKVKNKLTKGIIYFLILVCVYYTTTKGVIIAGIVVILCNIISVFMKKMVNSFFKAIVWASSSIMIILPLTASNLENLIKLLITWGTQNQVLYLVNSFISRINDAWPNALEIILEHGNFLLGRGIGGLGSSQDKFERALYNPCDNAFLYLYASFGLLSIFIIYYISKRIIELLNSIDKIEFARLLFLVCLFLLIYGIVSAIPESSIAMMILGIAFQIDFKKEEGNNNLSIE